VVLTPVNRIEIARQKVAETKKLAEGLFIKNYFVVDSDTHYITLLS